MREALLEETAAGPAVGPCCCSVAAGPVHTARPCRPSALLGMLGPALTLALLVLTGRQSQASFDSPSPRLVVSGAPLRLHVSPSIQTRAASVKWKVELRSMPRVSTVLIWKSDPDSDVKKWKCNVHFKNTRCFITENRTLVIEAAQPQHSGIYVLEATNETGESETHLFNVSVWDPVETPRLQEQQEPLDGGKCRVTLSCSISRGGDVSFGNVSYTWYRGSERIQGPRNLSILEEQIDDGPHIYTCEVSNLVSRANQTLRLSPGCHSLLQGVGLLPFWMIILSLVTALLLGTGTLTWVCVRRRRRRKWAEPSPEETVTVYEDVNNLRTRSGYEQRDSSSAAGTTIYSMILAQPSASASQRTENTLYSVVQHSRKSGSEKRKQSPSLTCTIYEEVGKIQAKAWSPALTRKELENFRVYC